MNWATSWPEAKHPEAVTIGLRSGIPARATLRSTGGRGGRPPGGSGGSVSRPIGLTYSVS
ncbi:MAG TPA: hypothetical protein VHA57_10950 [Actinomycetota bacterium]|nr:hypothetical protein [Actinomycetota bacterium]